MRRKTFMVDFALLKEAKRELGLRTYSATINAVLREAVRREHVSHLADFVCKVKWIGDLSEMRADSPRKRASKRPQRKTRII
jgi:Arc/MetJ family transcription regulator